MKKLIKKLDKLDSIEIIESIRNSCKKKEIDWWATNSRVFLSELNEYMFDRFGTPDESEKTTI